MLTLHPDALIVMPDGTFDLNDVFSLSVVLLTVRHPVRFERTTDPHIISRADLVLNVGRIYDGISRFDPCAGGPTRPDGTPYRCAGLVWLTFGEAAVKGVLQRHGADARDAARIADEIERSVVAHIDAYSPQATDGLRLAQMVEDLNPPWNIGLSGTTMWPNEGACFDSGIMLVTHVLTRRIINLQANFARFPYLE